MFWTKKNYLLNSTNLKKFIIILTFVVESTTGDVVTNVCAVVSPAIDIGVNPKTDEIVF